MNHLLKVKTKIACQTCGAPLRRTKTFMVTAQSKEEAIREAQSLIQTWQQSLIGQNCTICQTILNDVNKEAKRCS